MTDQIRQILSEHARLPVDVSSLGDDDDLFQAGMTSHASVNVMLALEDAFDVEFPEAMLRKSTFESIAAIARSIGQLAGVGGATVTVQVTSPVDLVGSAVRIGREVAGEAAVEVDRDARFPSESIEAAKAAGLLGVLVPATHGGAGASVAQAGATVFGLARYCASSGMILAMHHMQVQCLAEHGRTPLLEQCLADVATNQLLLASATTEAGVGGSLRTSICALERDGGRFRLEKQAPVISYGAQADAVMTTARRGPDSPPGDQVLVLCAPPGLQLEQKSQWDALGFRGTCSPGFVLTAEGDEAAVLPVPFGDIAGQTMSPVAHVLWGHVWLGVAASAMDRARTFVQAEARRAPGSTPRGATGLAEAAALYAQMEALVHDAARRYDGAAAEDRGAISWAVWFNSLKVSCSRLVVAVVTECLAVCGMAGYRDTSPLSLGRQLRDAHGAALMVNNDRILADNAQLLLVAREER